jgi:hypothetical protein
VIQLSFVRPRASFGVDKFPLSSDQVNILKGKTKELDEYKARKQVRFAETVSQEEDRKAWWQIVSRTMKMATKCGEYKPRRLLGSSHNGKGLAFYNREET